MNGTLQKCPCRICLEIKTSCISIYDLVMGKYLPELIDNLCGVQISALDEPDSVCCTECATALLNAEEIVNKCKKSHEMLTLQQQSLHSDFPTTSGQLEVAWTEDSLKAEKSIAIESSIKLECVESSPSSNSSDEDCDKDGSDVRPQQTENAWLSESPDTQSHEEPQFKENPIATALKKEGITKAEEATKQAITETRLKRKYQKHKEGPRVMRVNRKSDFHFKCELCDFESDFAKYYRNHLIEVHQQTQPKIFKCAQCTESYVHYRTLLEHVERLHDQSPANKKFLCADCGKEFHKYSHLHQHTFVHKPDQRPHKCDFCPKLFINPSSLQRHVAATHSADKPFSCKLCDKTFALQYGLTAHLKYCHPVDTFQCNICGFIFRKKKSLESHVLRSICTRKEAIGYPFPCNLCPKGFAQKYRLQKHLKTAHSMMTDAADTNKS